MVPTFGGPNDQSDVILTEVQSVTEPHTGLSVAASSSPDETKPARVVLFRHAPVPRDSRAKKVALTLARAGYDVTIVSAEGPDATPGESRLGPVRIVHLPVASDHVQANYHRLIRNRKRRYPVVATASVQRRGDLAKGRKVRAAQVARQTQAIRERRTSAGSASKQAVVTVLWAVRRIQSELLKRELQIGSRRNNVQARIDAAVGRAWKRYDAKRVDVALGASARRDLPEILDLAAALRPVLLQLRPDVLHAHHPFVLGVADEVQRSLAAEGHSALVVYDARENFGGIPEQEQGSVRRHKVLMDQERRFIGGAAGVSTVSEPIADVLQQRYHLPRRPAVILNTPVLGGRTDGPTVRDVVGLPSGVPLMVYSGTISHARGIDTLVRGLAFLPEAHLVIVSVPFPHPSVPALLAIADEVGAADRIHVVPPVDQGELIHYISGADVAVHPMPGGSPNHDQALPNKLFEYVHAGLPLVVSDARLMADFVTKHHVGEVFVAGDPRSFADAVTRVLGSPAGDPERLAALARQFSWQGQEQEIVDYYNSLTGYDGRVPSDEEFPSVEITKETAS